MISYKTLLWPLLFLCMISSAHAQVNDTAAADINPQIDNNQVKFGSALPPLHQVAGAPAAFYSYFWEFGDGSYSFEKKISKHPNRPQGLLLQVIKCGSERGVLKFHLG